MTAQEMNIAIHEWRGFRRHTSTTDPFKCDVCGLRFSSSIWAHWELPKFWCGDPDLKGTPDYSGDLNAIHEAENSLDPLLRNDFIANLWTVTGNEANSQTFWSEYNFRAIFACIHATAEQRCEALLKTLNLWKETEDAR